MPVTKLPAKTKIICTMGPACNSKEKIEQLIDAGMNVARINFSHGTHEQHKQTIDHLKEARKEKGVPLAIMLDTNGPEIRAVAVHGGEIELNKSEKYTLQPDHQLPKNEREISIYPDLVIDQLHGKMKKDEKNEVMQRFIENKSQILVSTSVVEVGVNIPNASIMMIEGSERFGLAQLHQFRGRVGRSNHQSYCFVLSDSDNPQTNIRLNTFAQCTNGFDLAEYDLHSRGAGQLYGTRQSGSIDLKLADLTNAQLLKNTRDAAHLCIKKDNLLDDYPQLQEKINQFEQLNFLE